MNSMKNNKICQYFSGHSLETDMDLQYFRKKFLYEISVQYVSGWKIRLITSRNTLLNSI